MGKVVDILLYFDSLSLHNAQTISRNGPNQKKDFSCAIWVFITPDKRGVFFIWYQTWRSVFEETCFKTNDKIGELALVQIFN